MIKNKLKPATHSLLLDQIDNELIKGHIQEIRYLQKNTESIDWDVPIPFDKDEMWRETQAKQRSITSNNKIIETSMMGIARQKYSNFAVAQEHDAVLQKRNEDIADKIDILRNSKQFEKGSKWLGQIGDPKNARLIEGIKKK